ncbi:MAG: (2Fe-2S) ferredoxin domain-containing protein [Bacilli bacterium]|jgi:NADH:ubiquinone oxidoreductase subunit E|nr:(2Fe-2S) ferredoxin domain-containing protein [Bacilli bacterium]MCH4210350.1 (2Fe-2S) ferredoxin domain-containing protein [Bacilli bacterium]MCH4228880.1 (2Fe-2S) ferredoxin domain-containing protein [Bacilli bacterium]MCH4277976.1 (2Fe-2S) ferredoxin domain-containing protein [Bacilli bacterium]MCI2054760.1 (2Fe-2S) ferredoxin domain-containing protein [Bacilli bacterium]
MLPVSICVGSSCHLKGSHDVIEAMREEIKKRHLEDSIELKAAFCLGRCGFDGVSIKVGEKIITGVSVDNLPSVFDKEIVPALSK